MQLYHLHKSIQQWNFQNPLNLKLNNIACPICIHIASASHMLPSWHLVWSYRVWAMVFKTTCTGGSYIVHDCLCITNFTQNYAVVAYQMNLDLLLKFRFTHYGVHLEQIHAHLPTSNHLAINHMSFRLVLSKLAFTGARWLHCHSYNRQMIVIPHQNRAGSEVIKMYVPI